MIYKKIIREESLYSEIQAKPRTIKWPHCMAGKLAQKCQLEMVLAMKCHHVCGLTFNFCVHLNNYADNRLTLKEFLELITSLTTMQNSQTESLNILFEFTFVVQ